MVLTGLFSAAYVNWKTFYCTAALPNDLLRFIPGFTVCRNNDDVLVASVVGPVLFIPRGRQRYFKT
jgi:hypothetical protein